MAVRERISILASKDVKLKDSVKLWFGDGASAGGLTGDVSLTWNGTNFVWGQATANSSMAWGADGAGIDHIWYGDTASVSMTWDQSRDALVFTDNAKIELGTGNDIVLNWDGTSLKVTQAAVNSAIQFGVSGAGIDILWFGDTAGADMTWDQSADSMIFGDNGKVVFGTGSDVTIRWDGTDLDILSVADDGVIKFGTGTNSFDIWWYGNIATAYMELDASANNLILHGPMRLQGFNRLSPAYELKWVAGQRGKPGVNGDIQSATEATREIADPDFELLGTNAVSTCSAYNTAGGLTLTTTTGANDQVIVVPHLDASQSAWGTVLWPTSKELKWSAIIATGASITAVAWWAGLKLTNTSVTATDDDQCFFRYEDTVNTGKIEAVSSIAGTDTATDTAVAETVSTVHHLAISIASDRTARMFLDGALIKTTTALTSANLIPYIGVQTTTTAAKVLTVYGQTISRAL